MGSIDGYVFTTIGAPARLHESWNSLVSLVHHVPYRSALCHREAERSVALVLSPTWIYFLMAHDGLRSNPSGGSSKQNISELKIRCLF